MTEVFGHIEITDTGSRARCAHCQATVPEVRSLNMAEQAAWAAGWHRRFKVGWLCNPCFKKTGYKARKRKDRNETA